MDTLLFLAALPVFLILLFVYNKDKEKEPIQLLVKLFLLGIASCFLVLTISAIMEYFLPFMAKKVEEQTFIETILYVFIGVALVEEGSKWLILYKFGYNHKEFDEAFDIIVYSICVSLGFAFLENIMYIFLLSSNSFSTAIFRAICAIPGHASDAVFMGYYLSIAKQYFYKKDYKNEKRNIILSIIIPTILHGIYDYCLMSGFMILVFGFIIFIFFLYVFSLRKIKEISSSNKKIKYKNNFCGNCGKEVVGDFCPNCGTRQE